MKYRGPVGYGHGGTKSNNTCRVNAGITDQADVSSALRATSEELTAAYSPQRGTQAWEVGLGNCNTLRELASLEVIYLVLSATGFQGV